MPHRSDATPRRLVLRAEGLQAKQANSVEVVSGPPKSAGEGAAMGFARKLGVDVSALQTVKTPKGEHLAFRKKVKGREAAAILAEALPGIILGIPWPKAMYWTGKGGARFIRPIRWLVALLGNKVVPFEIAGVKSGNLTTGHRRLGKKKIRVSIADYEEKLKDNFVLVSAAARRAKIEREIPVRIKPDPELLNTLVYITEYPTPIVGEFDPQFLSLPEEVLVTVMRHHQKYFSVVNEDGSLAPCFVAVMNTSADPEGLVRRGNERVLRARFNDARFFWNFDQQKKLADRVQDLAHVTFQAKLGSYLDKTKRMMELVGELGGCQDSRRAAELSKCDLTCEMVKEFTELQGVVGGLYAQAQGEPDTVARAIYDHYKPTSSREDDELPKTDEGCLVSIADKIDTLRGCSSIGLLPRGSSDPHALRRAAQAVVRILVWRNKTLKISLKKLVRDDDQLEAFFADRIRYYFRFSHRDQYPYDEVNAVLAAGYDDLRDVRRRLAAIHAVRPTENFVPLVGGVKRIKNILRQAQFSGGAGLDPDLLEAGPERNLHDEFLRLPDSRADYRTRLEAIAALRPRVDLFFDKVLVNAPDDRVRQNRLTLLSNLLTEFSKIADFSEIVTE